jgi:hypothetical protein
VGNLNCHFVSRFLTTPWEFGQRRLHFYDTKAGCFRQNSSRTLFTRRGANTPEVEHRLDELIETPLGGAIRLLTRSPGEGGHSIEDWRVFRALTLLFPFQLARISQDTSPPRDLATMCSWPDEEVDKYAWAMKQLNKFITVTAHPGMPFFYPSKGYFIIPLAHAPSLYPGAIAIPLTERHAIASVSSEIDDEHVREVLRMGDGAVASNASVGTNSERVLVHPSVMNHANRLELRVHIEENQSNNLKMLQAVVDFNRTAVSAFAEAGLQSNHALNWIAGLRKGSRKV